MPKFQNVSPLGALDLPLVGRVVAAGEVIQVNAIQARHLEGQADWKPVKNAPATRAQQTPQLEQDAAAGGDDQTQED